MLSSRRSRNHAFTLVELLVVIGIIALLISILLPALSAARKQAAAVKCAAQLRDIGNAYSMYAIDNKGYFPVVQHDNYVVGDRTTPGTGANAAFWWDFLSKYVTKTKMGATSSNAAVASEQRKNVFWGCPGWDGYISGSIIVVNRIMPGYSMNWDARVTPSFPANGGGTGTQKAIIVSWLRGKFFKQSQWVRPAEKVLLADGKFYSLEQLPMTTGTTMPGQETRMDITYSLPSIPGQNTYDVYRHGKAPGIEAGTSRFSTRGGKVGFNILYCDGHVSTATDRETGYRAIRQRFPG